MASKLIITSNNELKFDSDEAMKRRLKAFETTPFHLTLDYWTEMVSETGAVSLLDSYLLCQ